MLEENKLQLNANFSNRGTLIYWLGLFSISSSKDYLHFIENCEVSTESEDYERGFICLVDEEGRPKMENVAYTAGSIEDLARIMIRDGYVWGIQDQKRCLTLSDRMIPFKDKRGEIVKKKITVAPLKDIDDGLKFQNYLASGRTCWKSI